MISEIEKYFAKAWENVEKETEKLEEVKESIRHPHFYYAIYDSETGEIKYKLKKWYKWFSGKRIVQVKIKGFNVKELPSYATIPRNNGK